MPSNSPLRSVSAVGITLAAILVSGGLTALPARADANDIKPGTPHAISAAAEVATDQFIVGMKETAGPASIAAGEAATEAASKVGARAKGLRQTATGSHVVKTDRALAAHEAEGFLTALRADPDVQYAEPDAIMQTASTEPNDGLYSLQWDLWEEPASLRAPGAWDVSRGEGVVVAVVDTGITGHSELDANVLPGYDMISNAAAARDGDGRDADPTDEGDWVSAGQCSSTNGDGVSSWHGTHVAGTIGAIGNNGNGVTGVAPEAKILPMRALGACGGYTSDIADSIIWAAGGVVARAPMNANPARVINLSLGGINACSATYQNAINFAYNSGAAVVVAAGNSNRPAADSSPANCQNVITVAASGRAGDRAPYSNYGFVVDVTAPGGDMRVDAYSGILSTSNFGTTTADEEAYEFLQGTSMAAPHVAGVAALLISEMGGLMTPAKVEARLKETARPLESITCWVGCGSGLVDATAALDFVVAESPVVPAAVTFSDVDGALGDTYTIPTSEGVEYVVGGDVVPAGTYPGSGTVSVLAKILSGYVFADGAVKEWTHIFDATSVPELPMVPGSPTITGMLNSDGELTAQAGEWGPAEVELSYQWFADGEPVASGRTYSPSFWEVGDYISVEVTGRLQGYTTESRRSPAVGPVSLFWNENVIPEPVTFIDKDGTAEDQFVVPSSPGAVYYLDGTLIDAGSYAGDGTVTVTARGFQYYELYAGATRWWSTTFKASPFSVTPPRVVFSDLGGTSRDTYTIPAADGVEYSVGGTDVEAGTYPGTGTTTVTALAKADYFFAEGTVAKWSTTFMSDSETVTPAGVTFTDKDGTAEDTYTVPETEGVEYLVADSIVAAGSHPGWGTVRVSARAKTDYVLAAGAVGQWSHDFKATPYQVTPAAVTFTDKDGTADDTYTVPAMDGVEYLVGNGVVAAGSNPGLGTVTVSARTKADYVLASGAAAEWSHSFSAKFPAVPGSMVPVTPFRALDTRTGAAVGPDSAVSFQVAGVGGVPAGVSAVVFNMTVAEAKSFGFVTAYASGASRPNASNVNFNTGQIVSNSATVPVGADGKVTLFNRSSGATHLLADISGYYLPGTPTAAGAFAALAPTRFLDTRSSAPVGADSSVSFQVAGVNGVPASVSAVVLNLTVAEAKSFGFITAYPSGTGRPNASNVNFNTGQIIPNSVTVPVGADGKVTLFNRSSGATHLLADVSGYYLAGTPTAAGTFRPVTPTRFLDTRSSAPAGADSAVSFQVGGANGIPAGASAVVFNMTVAEAKSFGFATAYASGTGRPNASNVNFNVGQIVPNSVTVPLGADGKVALFNRSSGSTHLLADVSGYFLP